MSAERPVVGAGAPLRVVLDTQVILDLWVFGDSSVKLLGEAMRLGRIAVLRCPACDAELADVLRRDFMRHRLDLRTGESPEMVERSWQAHSLLLADPQARAPWSCRDPDDQKFIDFALACEADLLLSKDRALLALDRHARPGGLRILRPETAAHLLRAHGPA